MPACQVTTRTDQASTVISTQPDNREDDLSHAADVILDGPGTDVVMSELWGLNPEPQDDVEAAYWHALDAVGTAFHLTKDEYVLQDWDRSEEMLKVRSLICLLRDYKADEYHQR